MNLALCLGLIIVGIVGGTILIALIDRDIRQELDTFEKIRAAVAAEIQRRERDG